MTFAELEQKRQTPGGLTPAEKKQWEVLFNQDDYAIEQVFRVPVSGKVAIANQANRQIVRQWAIGEPNPITDIRVWFATIFRENPNLVHQLAWQDQKMLDPAYQEQLAKKNEQELRARFLEVCKAQGIANSDANFNLWVQSGPDPVVSWFNSEPVIVLESGDTLSLAPASREQVDQWASDARNKAFQANQDHLRSLRDSNDIAGLRKAAQAEYAEKHSPQTIATAQQERAYKELRSQYEKDSQAGYWEPLPAAFTKKQIYTWNAAEMRKQMSRYGASRILARIHGLTEIPDGSGGTINFEEKQQ